MGKIKVNKSNGFTVISNQIIRNKNISLKAKGLYAFMWSLPSEWDYSVAGLVTCCKEGKDAINEALRELENAGYLKRTQSREGGKFADIDYTLYETPFTENPQAEKPITENPQQINTNKTSKDKSSKIDKSILGKPAKKSYDVIVNELIHDEELKSAVFEFLSMCRGKNYTPQSSTLEKMIEKLKGLSNGNVPLAVDIVKQSIRKGWKDFYAIKADFYNSQVVSKPEDPENLARDKNGNLLVF